MEQLIRISGMEEKLNGPGKQKCCLFRENEFLLRGLRGDGILI